jgi:hypothetical protein
MRSKEYEIMKEVSSSERRRGRPPVFSAWKFATPAAAWSDAVSGIYATQRTAPEREFYGESGPRRAHTNRDGLRDFCFAISSPEIFCSMCRGDRW